MLSQQQVLQQQLTSVAPLLYAAEAALTAGAWHTAREQAAACLASIQPATSCAPGLAARVLLLQATTSSQLQDHEHAIQALDSALQLQPDCADALWQRAAAHAASGSHQASFLDLRQLSSLAPHYPGLREALQTAAAACSQQRRAAVQAAPPPPRRYSRITRGAPCSLGGKGSASDRAAGQQELYQVLGLSSGASREEVRRAYKQLAARLHPDKQAPGASQADRAAAEELFKAVSAAYQALMG
ncbi:hypothetical protein OEZ86_000609 [Tetradesmus obliquus]|nr:hypothetical protein OEZ86_000609 [Tetradesmus obliquus]